MSGSVYRVAFIGDDGHARLTETIEAETDQEAIDLAQGKLNLMDMLAIADVWLQSERIAIIARQEPVRVPRYAVN